MAKNKAVYSGVSRKQRVRASTRRDDHRRFGQRFADGMQSQNGIMAAFGGLAAFAVIFSWAPFLPEASFLLALGIFLTHCGYKKKIWSMPFRVPLYANKLMNMKVRDASDGGGGGKGNLYLGKDMETEEEVWARMEDANKHVLAIGTTGSGKTELLMGQLFGFVAQGSGALFVDGKASPQTVASAYNIARKFGRDPDLFIMDYLTGGKDVVGAQDMKRSNTYNPINSPSAKQNAEVMVSLLDTGKSQDVWSGRAIAYLNAIMSPLSYLGASGHMLLNARLLGDYASLERMENLYNFGLFLDRNGLPILLSEEEPAIWEQLKTRMESLGDYFVTLPGYVPPRLPAHVTADFSEEQYQGVLARVKRMNPSLAAQTGEEEKKAPSGDQGRTKALEQHGYITMQLTRALGDLITNYGYIYKDEIGEVDYKDQMLNRRICIVLLPALESSEANLAMLGKLTLLSLKAVLAGMLNAPPEGSRRAIIEASPANSRIPQMVVLDEVGYYMTSGMSVVPAQARAFGVALYFGTQAISDLMKAVEAEGKAIIDNTAMKFFGRLTSPEDSDTAKAAIGIGGKAYVQVANSMTYDKGIGGMGGAMRMDSGSQLQEVNQIAYDDLTGQENGLFHLVVGAKEIDARGREGGGQRISRMLAFFTGNMPPVEIWRRNAFCVVKTPPAQIILKCREEQIFRNLRPEVVPATLRKVSPRVAALAQTAQAAASDSEKQALLATATEDDAISLFAKKAAALFTVPQSNAHYDFSHLGQFIAWRERLIGSKGWPEDKEERIALIRAWAKAYHGRHVAVSALAQDQALAEAKGSLSDLDQTGIDALMGDVEASEGVTNFVRAVFAPYMDARRLRADEEVRRKESALKALETPQGQNENKDDSEDVNMAA